MKTLKNINYQDYVLVEQYLNGEFGTLPTEVVPGQEIEFWEPASGYREVVITGGSNQPLSPRYKY